MQNITVLFCRRNTFVSKAIRKLTKSDYSHVALLMDVWGRKMVIDAQANGVNLKSFEGWKNKYQYEYIEIPVVTTEPKEIAKRAVSVIGVTAYDFPTLLFRHPYNMLTGKWKDKKNEEEKMTCSEFVGYALGYKDSFKLTPQDIYKRINSGYLA